MAKNESSKKITWYVRPMNDYTYKAISEGVYPDGIVECKERVGGEDLHLIETSFATLRFIENSKLNMNLDFKVYYRRGPTGPVRISPFVDGKLRVSAKSRLARKLVLGIILKKK